MFRQVQANILQTNKYLHQMWDWMEPRDIFPQLHESQWPRNISFQQLATQIEYLTDFKQRKFPSKSRRLLPPSRQPSGNYPTQSLRKRKLSAPTKLQSQIQISLPSSKIGKQPASNVPYPHHPHPVCPRPPCENRAADNPDERSCSSCTTCKQSRLNQTCS